MKNTGYIKCFTCYEQFKLIITRLSKPTAFSSHCLGTINKEFSLKVFKSYKRPQDLINHIHKNIHSYERIESDFVIVSKTYK